jgi:hypothetical protein
MTRPKPAGAVPQRKKSVSKASAAKGREDSRAVQIKREKEGRSKEAHQNPRDLAEMYAEREQDTDRQRKVHRSLRRRNKT